MPTYETLFIALPNLTEEEEKTAVAGLAQVVTDMGGVWTVNERMGRRRLAYPIKKYEDGIYVRFLYDASEKVPRELERRLRISDKVLRHMTVRLEEDWAIAAKEQAIRDAAARAEAEAARAAAAAAGEPVDESGERVAATPRVEGQGEAEPRAHEPGDEPADDEAGEDELA